MRIQHKKPEPDPVVGSVCKITKFLWWPLRIGDETRWLETASFEMVARGLIVDMNGDDLEDEDNYFNYWEATKWL